MTHEIATREELGSLARLDTQTLISQAIEAKDVGTLERMVALAERVHAVQARQAWYAAMAEFQRDCPTIKKTKRARIATRTGPGYEYTYAPLEEILATTQPVMGRVGLSVSWHLKDVTPEKVTLACSIAHELGHVETSGDLTIPVVVSQDGSGANLAQRVGIAIAYAKRYSLLGAVGMAPEDDEDGGRPEPRREAAREDTPPEDGRPAPGGDQPITEGQLTAFHAIAGKHGWSDDQKHALLSGYKLDSSKQIPMRLFNALTDKLKQGPEKGLKSDGKQTSL